jgi:hypothetical protein
MNGIQLSRLPLSGKVFCTLYLVGIGCGALAAVTQAATAVGLSPADVRASLAPQMPMTHLDMTQGGASAEKEISLGDISQAAGVWIRTPLLIQTSHTHLFGQTLIAGLLGLIFLCSSLGERTKSLVVALPFVGTLIDIGGMWLTRFVSPSCGALVIVGGGLFGLGYLLIMVFSMYELWLKPERVVRA